MITKDNMTAKYAAPIYNFGNLETAACLWEAVCDMESDGETRSAPSEGEARGEAIRVTRERIGSAELRTIVVGWTDAVEAAWVIAQAAGYDFPFDWEFVPGWIIRNVDWSDPRCPTVRKPSALDALAPDLRVWLVDEMGMEVELGGGGCTYLRHEGPNGSHLLVTCEGGGGMPTADSWQVGAYRSPDSEGELNFYSSDAGSTLRGAVDDACEFLSNECDVLEPVDAAARLSAVVERLVRADIIPDAEAFAVAMRDAGDLLARLGIKVEPDAAASDLSEATGLIVSGLELLDDVEFVTAGAESDDAGSFVTADGVTYLFTVERFTPHA